MKILASSTRETILEHDGMVFMVPHPYYVDKSGYTHVIKWDSLHGTRLSRILIDEARRKTRE